MSSKKERTSRRVSRRSSREPLDVETLEARTLLSTTTFDGDKLTVALDPNVFRDGVTIRCAGGKVDGIGPVDGYPQGVECKDVGAIEVNGTSPASVGGGDNTIDLYDVTEANGFNKKDADNNLKLEGHITLNGAGGDDNILGSFQFSDTIDGGSGADVISGFGGNDKITGGAGLPNSDGNDTISGGIGNDTIYGDGGNDTIYGGMGNDVLDGGTHNDRIWGDDDDDTLTGGEGNGNDTLWGGIGADKLDGQAGNDYMCGGTFETPDDGVEDTITGGEGTDTSWGGLAPEETVAEDVINEDVESKLRSSQ